MMKDSLPAAAKIGKDAKESVQECASEYISFLASEAAEHSNGEKRKTLVRPQSIGQDLTDQTIER